MQPAGWTGRSAGGTPYFGASRKVPGVSRENRRRLAGRATTGGVRGPTHASPPPASKKSAGDTIRKRGESAEICVAFITVPRLEVRVVRQRYTRLRGAGERAVYLYESLESDFRSELPVDGEGLLLEYPGYFRRACTL